MEDGHGLSRLFEVSRTLPRGPEAVYAALVDPAARLAWSPGLEAVELDGGHEALGEGDGGLAAGAAWTETRRLFGDLQTEHVTVVEARPSDRLVLQVDGARGSSRSGTHRYTWTLAPDGGGTRASVVCDAGDLSRKGAILVRFLIGPFQRAVDEELDGLARWMEGRS